MSISVPGVYQRDSARSEAFPRVRTDVVGFVGVAGPQRLHEAVRLEDWRDYEQLFLTDGSGGAIEPPLGTRLAEAVRAFFSNGGARCWVVNVAESLDTLATLDLFADLLGIPRDPPAKQDGHAVRHVGLERLLLVTEVSLIVIPELHATRIIEQPRVETDPESHLEQSRFFKCDRLRRGEADAPPPLRLEAPVFSQTELQNAQRYLLERCDRERWRVMALVEPPAGLSPPQVRSYRQVLGRFECAAMYWPWTLVQERPGEPVRLAPPSFSVAGVFARRDLARGPHVSPANEAVAAVVGLEYQVQDKDFPLLYDGDADHLGGVNLLRSFPQRGIRVWGARTLSFANVLTSEADPLAYVQGRRCLSAIERNVERLSQRAVFETNGPLLWAHLTQAVVSHLLRVRESGALAGAEPNQSFFVRCDSSVNPPAEVDKGRLICEIGVSLTVPAEFVVFRIGRHEGVVEIEERVA